MRSKRALRAACASIPIIGLLAGPAFAATYTVTSGASTGAGTLREAITSANAAAGADIIVFDSSVTTVVLAAALPSITGTLTIDGSLNGSYVELDGATNSVTGNGLTIAATGCAVYGLDIRGFSQDGININSAGTNSIIGAPGKGNVIRSNGSNPIDILTGANGVLVQANIIGLQRDGTTLAGNVQGLENRGANVTIGGDTPAERNIISGCTNSNGMNLILGTGTVVQGNYIGTDITGTLDRGNAFHGVYFQANNITVGGPNPGEGNLISGNGNAGIQFSGVSSTLIQGNTIGRDLTGTQSLPNGTYGIYITGSCTGGTIRDNLLGGASEMVSIRGSNIQVLNNTIVEGSAGVACEGANAIVRGNAVSNCFVGLGLYDAAAAKGNLIVENTVTNAAGYALGLGWWGPYSNDPLDADSGKTNNYQNYPVIGPVLPGDAALTGVLPSAASKNYRLDFYRSAGCHATGFGGMEEWLGTMNVTTDASGNAPFTFTLPTNAVAGQAFTATATDLATNDTSSISRCSVAEADPRPDLTSITRAVGEPNPNYAATAAFQLAFDEPITGLTTANLGITQTNTLTGSSIQSVAFPHGNAITMTRTMALTRPGTFDLSNRSFTVEFWCKRSSLNAGNDMFIHCRAADSARQYLHIGFNTYTFRFGFYGDDLVANSEWGLINEWQHWACTYDVATNQKRIYLNGVVQAQGTAGGPLSVPGTLTIGAAPQGGFEGKLDEVRIWGVARTQAEIQTNLYTPATGSEADLLALYQFDAFADLGVNADGADDVADKATGAWPLDVSVGSPTIGAADVPSTTVTVTAATGSGDGALGVEMANTTNVSDQVFFAMNTPAVTGQTFLAVDNDAPTDVALDNATVDAGLPVGTVVGNLSATDPDNPFVGQTFIYALAAGAGDTDNASFQIVGDQLQTNTVFLAGTSVTVRVSATDNGTPAESFSKQFAITVSPAAVRDWAVLGE